MIKTNSVDRFPCCVTSEVCEITNYGMIFLRICWFC